MPAEIGQAQRTLLTDEDTEKAVAVGEWADRLALRLRDASGNEIGKEAIVADDTEGGVAGADQITGEFDDSSQGGVEVQFGMNRERGLVEPRKGLGIAELCEHPLAHGVLQSPVGSPEWMRGRMPLRIGGGGPESIAEWSNARAAYRYVADNQQRTIAGTERILGSWGAFLQRIPIPQHPPIFAQHRQKAITVAFGDTTEARSRCTELRHLCNAALTRCDTFLTRITV